jgi:hypothetical protein
MTPFDNLNVMKILRQLGANAIEDVVENDNISTHLTRG